MIVLLSSISTHGLSDNHWSTPYNHWSIRLSHWSIRLSHW